MSMSYNHYLHVTSTAQRIKELRAMAAEARMARVAQLRRPLRTRAGRALVAMGLSLLDQPLDVVIADSG
jgi:hypothetical protein